MNQEAITIKPFDNRDAIFSESGLILSTAGTIQPIESDEQMVFVAKKLNDTKKFIKATEESCRPRIKQVKDLGAGLLDDMNLLIAPAKKSVTIFSGLLVDYEAKLTARRREQEQERERQRIKADAEAREKEEKRRLEICLELEKSGKKEEADQVLTQVHRVIPIPVNIAKVEEPVKVEGLSFRSVWKAIMEAVDISEVDERFVKKVFDQDMANAYAKSNKAGAKAKGIKFYEEKTAVSRTK